MSLQNKITPKLNLGLDEPKFIKIEKYPLWLHFAGFYVEVLLNIYLYNTWLFESKFVRRGTIHLLVLNYSFHPQAFFEESGDSKIKKI